MWQKNFHKKKYFDFVWFSILKKGDDSFSFLYII